MQRLLPFLFLFAGVFTVFAVLFLVIRTDAVPSSFRSIRWRTARPTDPEVAAE